MSKVTSKLQVTIPRSVADRYGIRPGDEVRWEGQPLGPLVVREGTAVYGPSTEDRLRAFREFVRSPRAESRERPHRPPRERGWSREDLYEPPRGRPR